MPAMPETWVQFLGRGDPLKKEMAPHSNILAGIIPCTEEPGRLQSMGLQSQTWLSTHTQMEHTYTHTQRERILSLAFSSFQRLLPTFLLVPFHLQSSNVRLSLSWATNCLVFFLLLPLLPMRTLAITMGPHSSSNMLSSSQSKPVSRQFHLLP